MELLAHILVISIVCQVVFLFMNLETSPLNKWSVMIQEEITDNALKPVFTCLACMASFWGFWLGIWAYGVSFELCTLILGVCGLNFVSMEFIWQRYL